MRYVGQEHAVTVDLPLKVFERADRVAIKRAFDAMHEQRYGTSAPDERAEIVSLRSTVTGVMRKAAAGKDQTGQEQPRQGMLPPASARSISRADTNRRRPMRAPRLPRATGSAGRR